jgi:hypothetical protein
LFVGITGCSEFKLNGPQPASDRWVVTGKVDVLVFGDTSDSMQDELVDLGGNLNLMVSRLDSIGADWNLAAITGPDGCAQNGVLTGASADWQTAFAAGITTKPGEDLVDEWGLYDASQALDHLAAGDCNEGFLRDDAWLQVIFISDEDDNSPGWDSGDPDYWQTYVDAFLATKEDPSKVHLSAVAGPEPLGCTGAEPGRGYWEAAQSTNGTFLPICGGWVDDMDAMADSAIAQGTFPLSQTPTAQSVRVFVNDIERLDGWSYDAATNQVVFHSDLPFTGEEVHASYETSGY